MTAFEPATSAQVYGSRVFRPLGLRLNLAGRKVDHSLGELGGVAWHRLFLHRSSIYRGGRGKSRIPLVKLMHYQEINRLDTQLWQSDDATIRVERVG